MFQKNVNPPVPKRLPKQLELHGDLRTDDYYWLNERANPEVLAHLEAENAYLTQVLSPTQTLQEQLYQKMLSHLQESDEVVPVQHGAYFYYTRTEKGQQYAVHCRKQAQTRAELTSAPEEVLLDVNMLAEGKSFFNVSLTKPSPDHSKLAFLQNEDGSDRYTLYVKDLQTGKLLSERIENVFLGSSLEWASNDCLFYVTVDEKQRPHKLFRHHLGETTDIRILEENDEAYFLSIFKSDDGTYLFTTLGSMDTSEVYYLPAHTPDGDWRVFAPRVKGIKYSLEYHGGNFLIITDEQAPNFKLLTTPADNPGKENWQELFPHRPDTLLGYVSVFEQHWLILERQKGLTQLSIYDVASGEKKVLRFPEDVYTTYVYTNHTFATDKALISYESMVTPSSILELNLNTLETTLLKQKPVPNYDKNNYVTRRIWATASDGVQVPITLVHKKELQQPAPLLLYGYGAYGSSVDPTFGANRLALLDKGMMFAVAHVRGSSLLGRQWHEDGKLLNKKNTFSDFIACAEHLIREGLTTSAKLAALGASAGGLLMGAVTTMRPDLFRAVVAKVPFVDVVTTMLDESLPLVKLEYDEWGNPNHKAFYDYMKSYSPYDNVKPAAYPHLLVTAGLNDPRVSYFEPAKWVAKLREHNTGNSVVLLETNLAAGHGGSSGRYDYLRETALEYAFILTALEEA
jgi:oligopeptidase B